MTEALNILNHIWQKIVESNTFNFIIFAAIIIYLIKKINVSAIFDNLHKKIVDAIETAKKTRELAHKDLESAQKAVATLEDDVKTMLTDASKSAEKMGAKLIEDAKAQVSAIESNVKKVVDAEEKAVVSLLTKKTSKASVEVAKNQVISALAKDVSLHEKYINESIDSLDRLNF